MSLQRRRLTNRKFRRLSYRACTRPFGYVKHVNKAYNLVVCEFEGFENVLRDAGICAIHMIMSTDVMIYLGIDFQCSGTYKDGSR